MSCKKFFEEAPLYENFKIDIPLDIINIKLPSINLFCKKCGSIQTFVYKYKTDRYGDNYVNRGVLDRNSYSKQLGRPQNAPINNSSGEILNITYRCEGCKETKQFYSIKINDNQDYIMKIGQFPPWNITINKNLKKILKNHEDIYKKGLECESQGYGIGAFAYYRRIVENTIDDILNRILEIVTEGNKKDYIKVLEQAKQSHRVEDKINIIKNELPVILMPEGDNPLKSLYTHLSEGIHASSDEECLKKAKYIKNILIFIIDTVVGVQNNQKEYKNSVKKLQNM
jgi:hypothetical protein